VDSPQETRIRLLLVLAGLPEPRVNLIIRGRDGGWRRRYDLAYEELQLIVEYDGRQHAEDTEQWLTDIFRREELDQIRWRLVIVTSEGIYREPLRTLERVGMRWWRVERKGSAGCSSRNGGCTSQLANARRLGMADAGALASSSTACRLEMADVGALGSSSTYESS
jgi:hypothetical protein